MVNKYIYIQRWKCTQVKKPEYLYAPGNILFCLYKYIKKDRKAQFVLLNQKENSLKWCVNNNIRTHLLYIFQKREGFM